MNCSASGKSELPDSARGQRGQQDLGWPARPRGRRLWFGLDRGASLAGLDGTLPFPIATDHLAYWLRQNPSFDWHTVTESSFQYRFPQFPSPSSKMRSEPTVTDLDGFIDIKARILPITDGDLLIFSRARSLL